MKLGGGSNEYPPKSYIIFKETRIDGAGMWHKVCLKWRTQSKQASSKQCLKQLNSSFRVPDNTQLLSF